MEDSWSRDNLKMLTNLALPCAIFFLGDSAAAVTVRVEAEPWQLANFGRRIKAEVPAGAMVVTSEMSMVQTYYAKRHVIRGVPDGAHLESKLGMMQDICPDLRSVSCRAAPECGKIPWRARPPAAGL